MKEETLSNIFVKNTKFKNAIQMLEESFDEQENSIHQQINFLVGKEYEELKNEFQQNSRKEFPNSFFSLVSKSPKVILTESGELLFNLTNRPNLASPLQSFSSDKGSIISELILSLNFSDYLASSHLLRELTRKFIDLGEKRFNSNQLFNSPEAAQEYALKLIRYNEFPNFKIVAFEGDRFAKTIELERLSDQKITFQEAQAKIGVEYLRKDLSDFSLSEREFKRLIGKRRGELAALFIDLPAFDLETDKKALLSLCQLAKENQILIWVNESETFLQTKTPFLAQQLNIFELANIITFKTPFNISGVLIDGEQIVPKEFNHWNQGLPSYQLKLVDEYLFFLSEKQIWEEKNNPLDQLHDILSPKLIELLKRFKKKLLSKALNEGFLIQFVFKEELQESNIETISKAFFEVGLLISKENFSLDTLNLFLSFDLSKEKELAMLFSKIEQALDVFAGKISD